MDRADEAGCVDIVTGDHSLIDGPCGSSFRWTKFGFGGDARLQGAVRVHRYGGKKALVDVSGETIEDMAAKMRIDLARQ
jgi:hypothetical protein